VQDKNKDLALIAQRIRLVRNELKLTQVEFAEKLGLDQTTISKWEREKARPTPEALVGLASIAHDINKLFFLAHAGLPEQYLTGEPMIPEILEASARVVESVTNPPQQISAPPSTRGGADAIPWDREVMAFAIETVDKELKKRGRTLPIDKYAQMIVLFYELCHETKSQDPDMVERLLMIA